jgi:hypothetical protein
LKVFEKQTIKVLAPKMAFIKKRINDIDEKLGKLDAIRENKGDLSEKEERDYEALEAKKVNLED